MSDMSQFARFDHLFESAQSGSKGKYWSKLDEADKTLILDFLETSDLSEKSRQSYKSYLSKAIIMPDSLSRDQMSALRKFNEYLKTR